MIMDMFVILGLWRKEERVGIPRLLRCIEVFLFDVEKFPTIENLKETLANFFKIPRVSLFRVPLFLVYAWSSFGSIPTQETRSKRLDVVEAVFTQIWTVLCFARFSAFGAFKPLRELKRTCR